MIESQKKKQITQKYINLSWHGVFVITIAHFYWIDPALRFVAGSNSDWDISEVCNGENLHKWSSLLIKLDRTLAIIHFTRAVHHLHHLKSSSSSPYVCFQSFFDIQCQELEFAKAVATDAILQKQLPRGIPRKRCSENMQQIDRRTPIPKCDFNKVALKRTPVLFLRTPLCGYF